MTLVQPNPELQIIIRKALNEDITSRDRDLQHIKEWLLKQPHLPDTWDDDYLMSFLRGCKFSLERCKRKLDMYFTIRSAVPEFFSNRDISRPELKKILHLGTICPLPGLTSDGKRVIVVRGKERDIDTPNLADVVKIMTMIFDCLLAAEKTGIAGNIIILDGFVATVKHFSKVTPALTKKCMVYVQEAYPILVKEIHIVNSSAFIDIIIKWFKPFLKEKLRKRIQVHSDLESLYKFVPKDILPEEYGGSAGTLEDFHDQWIEKLKENTPWFKAQENLKADESKRPGKPTNYEELFGVDGSFKQLDID